MCVCVCERERERERERGLSAEVSQKVREEKLGDNVRIVLKSQLYR